MILRHCICIPVFNNPETIVSVAESCLQQSKLPLLIVDDGSDQAVESLFAQTIPDLRGRISFLRFEKNQGKGIALQKAFKWAVAHNYTHLLTLDGDGQHSADDIEPMVQKSEHNPWALIVGDRNMETQNVPASSIFGKRFSNFWIHYETEKNVADSQSGYRIYPLFHVQTMRFFRKRYDFEVEVLTRLIWKKVEVVNVPIRVVYFPPEKRVSHFNKWKDNFFISVTNTWLVFASVFHRPQSPLKSSIALAIGVFVGVFPIYGLHTLIVGILGLILRLNFIPLWLGTQISLPPLVPFLFLGAHFIHAQIFQQHFEHQNSDWQIAAPDWIFSFLILALALSVAMFLIAYPFSILKNSKKSPKNQIVQAEREHLGIRFMNFVLIQFGLKPAYFCLYFIVPFYFLFNFRTRRAANEYWRVVLPNSGLLYRQVKFFQQIMSFARQLVDRAYQNNFTKPVFKMETTFSLPEFQKVMQNDEKGIVFVNSHTGAWDFAATLFREQQTDQKLNALVYGEENDYKFEAQSQNDAYKKIYFNQQSHSLIQLKIDLDRGQSVAFMADRPVGKNIELIPFFGKLAVFDSTAFKVAKMCHAKLCFVYCLRKPDGKIIVDIQLLDPAQWDQAHPANKEVSLYEMMVVYVQGLEKNMRTSPEQWYNFIPFWSERVMNE